MNSFRISFWIVPANSSCLAPCETKKIYHANKYISNHAINIDQNESLELPYQLHVFVSSKSKLIKLSSSIITISIKVLYSFCLLIYISNWKLIHNNLILCIYFIQKITMVHDDHSLIFILNVCISYSVTYRIQVLYNRALLAIYQFILV